ncbi:MAG: glycoside hydrolase family 15 protein [Xanthomonadales bacterium]|nr:glycoside hydrolase family 15 protein [Xanthomonadales bacterium]
MRLGAGEKRYFSLTYVQHDIATIAPLGDAAERRLEATLHWWESWAGRCRYEGPYRDAVVRSLLTLKLMTFQLSGAVIAAPTSSLPEDIGGVRNWDYRYCWLRDAALTFSAFADLGYAAEAEAFIDWLLHATRLTLPELNVLYDVYGGMHVPEEELDHLEGYRGSRPVRMGNDAFSQLQLDTYGALILAVNNYVLRGGELEAPDARMLRRMGNYVCDHWHWPDQGIWEPRGEPRHNTHSKLMCWVALDCLLTLADEGKVKVSRLRFEQQRESIAEAIHSEGFDEEKGTFIGAFGRDYVEAGLLLMAIYGFVDSRDPRMVETCHRIDRELGVNGLIYRYEHGQDGLPGSEGAFVICSFWMVEHLAGMGEFEQAENRFGQLLSLANDVGLLAEEADPADGSALGNFPQAYSHVGLIRAAVSLQEMSSRQHSDAPLDAR